jgi:hypothetical protein
MKYMEKMEVSLMPDPVQMLDSAMGHIRGKVVDKNGKQIHGCKIWIRETEQFAYSDMHGNFILINIRPARYTIIAEHMNYSMSISPDLPIAPGDNPGFRFVLHTAAFRKTAWAFSKPIGLGFQT